MIKLSDETISQIKEMKQTMTFRKIAKILNLPPYQVANNYYYRHGERSHRNAVPECDKMVELKDYNQEEEVNTPSRPMSIIMPDYFHPKRERTFSDSDIMEALKTIKIKRRVHV